MASRADTETSFGILNSVMPNHLVAVYGYVESSKT